MLQHFMSTRWDRTVSIWVLLRFRFPRCLHAVDITSLVNGWRLIQDCGGGQTNGGEKSSALTTDKHNPDHFVSPRYKDIHNEGHFVKDKYNFVISFGKHTETKTMRNILGTKTKVMKIILSHKHTKTNTIKTILSHKDKKTYNESHFVKGKHDYVILSGKLTKTKTMWTICICIYALWSNCCISVFLSPELRE